MPSPAEKIQSIKNAAIALSIQNGQYLTKAQILNNFPFPYGGSTFAENSMEGQQIKRFVNQLPESSFCVHSLSTGTVVNLCYEVVPESTQSPGGLTIEGVPGCTSLIDNTTMGCRTTFSITCNRALKVSEVAYYIHSGGLGDECVIAGRRDMGASSASSIVKEMSTPNEVKHTVLNRNMAIEQFMEQAARSGLEREGFVELIKREGIEFNGGNYTLASSPETFAWFLNLIDKIKDWPEPRTEEPTSSPEQGTSTEQGTDILQQPTETVNPYETEVPSTSEQDKPFEPAVGNTPNTTNSEPKDTEEPRATGPEQVVPETQPTDAITEEPRGPEPDPSIIMRQRANSSDPVEGKQVESESTQAPTIGLEAQSKAEDESDEQSESMNHHQANVLEYTALLVSVILIGGATFCSVQNGWCSSLFSYLFNKAWNGNSKQDEHNYQVDSFGTRTPLDSPRTNTGSPKTYVVDVESSPNDSPVSTPTIGTLDHHLNTATHRHPHNTEASRHPHNRLQLLRKNTFGLDSPSEPGSPGSGGFSMLPKSVVQKQAVVGSYNSDPETVKVVGMAEWGTDALEVRSYEDQ
jgi:hypothetical protein